MEALLIAATVMCYSVSASLLVATFAYCWRFFVKKERQLIKPQEQQLSSAADVSVSAVQSLNKRLNETINKGFYSIKK